MAIHLKTNVGSGPLVRCGSRNLMKGFLSFIQHRAYLTIPSGKVYSQAILPESH